MARIREMNPYAPPALSNDDAPPSGDDNDDRIAFKPASRGRRLLGALIDTFVNLLIIFALRVAVFGRVPSLKEWIDPSTPEYRGAPYILGSLVPFVIMALLINARGQTIGKIVMLTRIVDEEGRRAGLWNGFVLRTLPFAALGFIPILMLAAGMPFPSVEPLSYLLSVVSLIDVLFIFGAHRRCLHDQIAGTYVAVVGSERPRRVEAAQRPRKKKKRKAVDGSALPR